MIKILCVGKIKEDYLKNLIYDYQKRINKYMKIDIIELKDNPDYMKEINSLNKAINERDINIALDRTGDMLSSIEFAKLIDQTLIKTSNITFIIGGSLGLSKDILLKCDHVISFSALTFPHGLFRGILLEQIYRAFKINNNESYHK